MADARAAEIRLAPVWPMIAAQARSEFFRLIRVPAFSIPVIAFPIMFYALFGLPYAHEHIGGIDVGRYEVASFGAYSVISVALFSFGITVANDRAEKATRLMRAAPLIPAAYLIGKTLATLVFSALTIGALFVFAAVTGGIRLEPLLWITLTARLLLGVFPFITLGFAVGFLAGPNSAAAILQLINLPMSFASGLFVPLSGLPTIVRSIAPFLPAYHLGQLAWGSMGAPVEPLLTTIVWLAGYTAVFMAIALRAYYREETKTFG